MTIRKFLDLSTAHVTEETRDLLERGGVMGIVVDPHGGPAGEYGWLAHMGVVTKEE